MIDEGKKSRLFFDSRRKHHDPDVAAPPFFSLDKDQMKSFSMQNRVLGIHPESPRASNRKI
jgi:hypothetical protein